MKRDSGKMKKQRKLAGLLLLLTSVLWILCSCAGTEQAERSLPPAPEHASAREEASVPESRAESETQSDAARETPAETAPPDKSLSKTVSLEVHFIDVGQGDAILALCGGEAMLIDGGNKADSSLIYSYLKQRKIDHLKYIICTHPDEDHVGGLPGALNYATAERAYCSETAYDTRAFNSFLKYLNQQNVALEVPSVDTRLSLGDAVATVCGPRKTKPSSNDNSLVIRLSLGDISFLFTGDAEESEEKDMIAVGGLQSTVLKVGHHGSSHSTSDRFLDAVDPDYAVISCGAYNTYGHPTDATLNRLKKHDLTLFRTDQQGDIVCRTNGKTVSFTVEKNPDANTFLTYHDLYEKETAKAPASKSGGSKNGASKNGAREYVLNTRSRKFHYPDCRSVKSMKAKNTAYVTTSREELIAEGYDPCGNCQP